MKSVQILHLLLLTVSLVSCRKESITVDEQTVIHPPVEVNNVTLYGIVQGDSGPLSGAIVDVYGGEILLGTITTNQQGAFSTSGIDIPPGITVTLNARKEAFYNTPKRIKALLPEVRDLAINMTRRSGALFEVTEYANPGDNDLVQVSGSILDANGIPVPYIAVSLLYNLQITGSSLEAEGAFVNTDENGYYEALLPKDSVIYLNILQSNYSQYAAYCQAGWLNTQEVLIFGLLPFDLVGPFTEDTQLPTFNNAYSSQNEVILAATVLDCNGNPVTDGHITVSYSTTWGSTSSEILIQSNGTWNYRIDLCDGTLPLLTLQAFDHATGKKSAIVNLENVVSGPVQLGNLTACN